MAVEEKHIVALSAVEHGTLINALNQMRDGLIAEDQSTEAVDEILLKVIDAPTRRTWSRSNEAR